MATVDFDNHDFFTIDGGPIHTCTYRMEVLAGNIGLIEAAGQRPIRNRDCRRPDNARRLQACIHDQQVKPMSDIRRARSRFSTGIAFHFLANLLAK
jgi:hypothetical protein